MQMGVHVLKVICREVKGVPVGKAEHHVRSEPERTRREMANKPGQSLRTHLDKLQDAVGGVVTFVLVDAGLVEDDGRWVGVNVVLQKIKKCPLILSNNKNMKIKDKKKHTMGHKPLSGETLEKQPAMRSKK